MPYVVRDPDELLRPLCFYHAVLRIIAHDRVEQESAPRGECWDCAAEEGRPVGG